MFWEMRKILAANEEESALLQKDFEQICLVRAKAAAYIIQHSPEIIPYPSELEKIAQLLMIDGLYIIDETGTIYAGTDPEYFNMNFNSGEQIHFFAPMLEDKTLELCQGITPNTAEHKLMQYAAVWCEDGSNIVQIAMTPERVMEFQKKTELSFVFSMVTSEPYTDIYAIDADTLTILASTQSDAEGKTALELGFEEDALTTGNKVFFQEIDGTDSICIFDEADSLILATVRKSSVIFQALAENTVLLAFYVVALSGISLFVIFRYLNRNIIDDINSMNKQLQMIGDGHLSVKLPTQKTLEMTELSSHINDMVASLIAQQTQLSVILDTMELPIGTYDYNTRTNKLSISPRAADILGLSATAVNGNIDSVSFRKKMDDILHSPLQKEDNIYRVPGDSERYVHIEYFQNESNIFGIIMDMTKEVQEKQIIRHERDMDLLTNLLSRRAFYRQTEELFKKPESLKAAAFVMIDSDDLKHVNDTYGHNCGDLYLQAISDILVNLPANKLAARLSGDEFILLLYGYENRQELEKLLARLFICQQNAYLTIERKSIPVRFSTGCAFYPDDAQDFSSLMKLADKNMYADKKNRKGII